MADRIAVIGATGYLGRAVVPRLVAAGHAVRTIARSAPLAPQGGSGFMACDATYTEALARALDGHGVVINLTTGSPRAIERVAANLLSVIEQQPATRLIHVSSLAVFGSTSGRFDVRAAPCPDAGHHYAIAKLRAERLLGSGPGSAPCVILRPGCIYGPRAPVWSDRIGRLLLSGRLGDLGIAGDGIAPLIHVEDMANAIVNALDACAGIYHVVGVEPISWNRYFNRFANALGIAAPTRIGGGAWAWETRVRSPAMMLRGRLSGRTADIVTPVMRRLFGTRARIVAAPQPMTHDSNLYDLDEALREVAKTFRAQPGRNRWSPRTAAAAAMP